MPRPAKIRMTVIRAYARPLRTPGRSSNPPKSDGGPSCNPMRRNCEQSCAPTVKVVRAIS
eukprot:1592513-Alexandrium_andersonii.AAC.1